MAGIFRIIGGIAERLIHATSTEATATTAAKPGWVAAHVRVPSDRIAHALPRAPELSAARDLAGTGVRKLSAAETSRRAVTEGKLRSHEPNGRVEHRTNIPLLGRSIIVHHGLGDGTRLITTPETAAKIAHGEHQIDIVGGRHIDYPSQDIKLIESTSPNRGGQTHIEAKHLNTNLQANIERLQNEPHISASGSFDSAESAQFAIDRTIANPANQRRIAAFLENPLIPKTDLRRVDLGRTIGTSTLRSDLDAGRPSLLPSRTANVIIIKDPSFPEGYRVLTSYPAAAHGPQVDQFGNPK